MTSAAPLQFLILLVASWIGRRQGEAIEYLRVENRVLRARLAPKRLRFADAERRLVAQKGKPLGRKLLADMASLATPETILRWYREQVAAKYDASRTRGDPGRPASRGDKVKQLLTMARLTDAAPRLRISRSSMTHAIQRRSDQTPFCAPRWYL